MKGNASLFAAVDLGSNAFRMMIGQQVKHDQRFVIQHVKTLREPVRLAEGLQGKALDTFALERGWLALERFGKQLRNFEAGRVRAVATSAVRQAINGDIFLAGAEQRLGFRIDVISGREEAKLVYAGVAHTMPSAEAVRLVVDIGGGSTELIVGQGDRPLLTESIAIGSGTSASATSSVVLSIAVRCKRLSGSPATNLGKWLSVAASWVGNKPLAHPVRQECWRGC